ncbi:hypothetical protein [uncultured Parabacteroides sp.]|jgi:hypothetical protein|uniref:hypothetical protein n=1 Tax=uncultured Parabacteroides sp. TaxID=512312 RepID=UPI0025CE514D|nr:hypothetical protein [uncultured Parabacteroides sp.]
MKTYVRQNIPERNNRGSFTPIRKQNTAAFVDNRPKNKLIVQLASREIGDLDYGGAHHRQVALDVAEATGEEHRGGRHTTIDSLNASTGVTKYMEDFRFHRLLEKINALSGNFESKLRTVNLSTLTNSEHQHLWLLFLKKNIAYIDLKKEVDATIDPAISATKADRLSKNAQGGKPARPTIEAWYYKRSVPANYDEYKRLYFWVWNAFFRRTSKLGIDFTAALGKTIHFNLTGDVYRRALAERTGRAHTRRSAITYSEMRHLRKLWDRNKAPSVRFQQNTHPTPTTVSVQDVSRPFRLLDLFGPVAIKRIFQTPQWITASREYELNLGSYAANGRPEAKAAIQEGLNKMDRVCAKYHKADCLRKFQASRAVFGLLNPTSAGQVGTHYATVRSVIKGVPEAGKDPVNMREQMTAFFNAGLWNPKGYTIARILTELRAMPDDARKAKAAELGIPEKQLTDICDTSRGRLLDTPIDQDPGRRERIPRPAAERDAMAVSAQEYEKRGVPLSSREMASAGADPARKADPLTWREGICCFSIDETTGWGKQMKEDGFPTIAGGSGTAARLLKIYQWIGGENPINFRLALMGWMLPCKDHSLIEIMQGAEAVGVKGPSDRLDNPIYMYRSIAPIRTQELRANVAKESKFPDEHVLHKVDDASYKRLIEV